MKLRTGWPLVFAAAFAAGLGALVLAHRGATPASATVVVQRATVERAHLASELGPNTTFHLSVRWHEPRNNATGPFSVPNDYTEDTWISFGADGVMDADVVTYSTPDGNVFNQSVITTAGTSAVDFRTGTTQEGSGSKPIHASDLASEFRSDLAGISAIVQPDAAAPTTTVDGHRAVRVMSTTAHGVDIDFFDANTYQILRSETRDGDANGPITMALDFLHYDVLQGQVAPTPIPFTPADAASPTTVPEGGATPPPDPGLAGG